MKETKEKLHIIIESINNQTLLKNLLTIVSEYADYYFNRKREHEEE